MDCQQVQAEYSALLDGELDPETQAVVEAHLAGCAACLWELDKLKRVNDVYRQLPAHPAPEGFEGRVRAALRENVVALPRRRRRRLALWPALAAAAMLVVVAGAVLWQLDGPVSRMQMAKLSSEDALAPLAEERGRAEVEGALAAQSAGRAQADTRGPAAAAKGMPAADEARPTALAEPPRETLQSLGYIEDAGEQEALSTEELTPGLAEAGARVLRRDTDARSVSLARPGMPETEAAEPAADVPPAPPPLARQMVSTASRAKPMVMADAIEAAPAAPKAPATEMMGVAKFPDETEMRSRQATRGFGARKAGRDRASAQAAAKDGATKTVGSRTFVFREGTWYQRGYAGEKTVLLERGGDPLRTLVAKHGDVAAILDAGERIVFRLDKKWYRVAPGSDPGDGTR